LRWRGSIEPTFLCFSTAVFALLQWLYAKETDWPSNDDRRRDEHSRLANVSKVENDYFPFGGIIFSSSSTCFLKRTLARNFVLLTDRPSTTMDRYGKRTRREKTNKEVDQTRHSSSSETSKLNLYLQISKSSDDLISYISCETMMLAVRVKRFHFFKTNRIEITSIMD